MKFSCWLLLVLCFSTGARAQDYQEYQYPTDPYSSTPKPQPTTYQQPPYQAPYQAPYQGSGSSYTYENLMTYGKLEARYNYYDFKGSDLDNSSGFSVALQAPLFKPLYLSFGVNFLEGSNDDDESFDLTTLGGGVGLYIPIVPRFHLFAEGGVRFDISDGVLSYLNPDTFAVYIRPGARLAITRRVELAASVLFSSTDNLENTVVEINSYFALLSVLDIGAGVDFADNINTYHAGLRLRW